MTCRIKVPVRWLEPDSLPAAVVSNASKYTILNDSNNTLPDPTLKTKYLLRIVFGSSDPCSSALTVGFFAGQGTAQNGCPSKLSYNDPAFKNGIIDAAARHGIFKGATKPDVSAFIDFADEVGIPRRYGVDVWCNVAMRVGTAIDRFGKTGKSPFAAREAANGRKVGWKTIINGAAARIAFSGGFERGSATSKVATSSSTPLPQTVGLPSKPAPPRPATPPPPQTLQVPPVPSIPDQQDRINRRLTTSMKACQAGEVLIAASISDLKTKQVDHGKRIASNTKQISNLETQQVEHGQRIASNTEHISHLETEQLDHGQRIDINTEHISKLADRQLNHGQRITSNTEHISNLETQQRDHGQRIDSNTKQISLIFPEVEAIHKRCDSLAASMNGDSTAATFGPSATAKDISDLKHEMTQMRRDDYELSNHVDHEMAKARQAADMLTAHCVNQAKHIMRHDLEISEIGKAAVAISQKLAALSKDRRFAVEGA